MAGQQRRRIGVLSKTFGLAGGLRCALDAESIPQIKAPCPAWVGFSESFSKPLRLMKYEVRPDAVICFFEGITTQEQAEALNDQALFVAAEAIAYVDPFSDPRLIGFKVVDQEGRPLGTISSILRTSAQHVWSVSDDGHDWMMPAVEEFVVELRDAEQTAVVRLIPGLYDLEPGDDKQNAEG